MIDECVFAKTWYSVNLGYKWKRTENKVIFKVFKIIFHGLHNLNHKYVFFFANFPRDADINFIHLLASSFREIFF